MGVGSGQNLSICDLDLSARRFLSCRRHQSLLSRGSSWACIVPSIISCWIWEHLIKKKIEQNLKCIYRPDTLFIQKALFSPCMRVYAVSSCTAFPPSSFPVTLWMETLHQKSASLCNSLKLGIKNLLIA